MCDYIQEQEDANFAACYKAASRYGISLQQAEMCDDGQYRCPQCPWAKPETRFTRILRVVNRYPEAFEKMAHLSYPAPISHMDLAITLRVTDKLGVRASNYSRYVDSLNI